MGKLYLIMSLYFIAALLIITFILYLVKNIKLKNDINTNNVDIDNNSNDINDSSNVTNEDIKKSKNYILGKNFEKEIIKKLNSDIDVYKKILNGVIVYDISTDKITEIDIVLITYCGIYVIECKNWAGYINGNITDEQWNQIIYDKQTNEKNINTYPNPVLQNNYHIDFLKKYLNLDSKYFKSYVVFSDRSNISRIITNKQNIMITHSEYMIKDIINNLQNKDELLSYEQIDKIYMKLKHINIQTIKELKYNHEYNNIMN